MRPELTSRIAVPRKGWRVRPDWRPSPSRRARWKACAPETSNRVFYLDLKLLEDYFGGHRYHHTAPISMFYALREALAIIDEEGLDNRFQRIEPTTGHLWPGRGDGSEDAGGGWPAASPAEYAARSRRRRRFEVRQTMIGKGHRDSGGFGPWPARSFVSASWARVDEENVLLVLEALEDAMRREGYRPKESGKKAAEAFYHGAHAATAGSYSDTLTMR